ncbi:MAG: lamin tail domain-containing protein [Deltaproteobacteria bacterium]|nr:lamin tail domain-containing protein [Deltaproteobacteria bacterium]
MKRYGLVGILVLLAGCGMLPFGQPGDLVSRQPTVVDIAPAAGAAIAHDAAWAVQFSQAINPKSVHEDSLVVYGPLKDATTEEEVTAKWEAFVHGDVPLQFLWSEDHYSLQLLPGTPLPVGMVALFISGAIYSAEGIPLSQSPGVGSRPFVAFFTVSKEGVLSDGDDSVFSASGESVQPIGENSQASPVSGAATADTAGSSTPPEQLMLNEVLYDVPGSDTDGVLFIELHGTPQGNIGGYVIRCVNGDGGGVTETIVLPDDAVIPDDGVFVIADASTGSPGVTAVPNADWVANFDPQNGPDAVQLLAPDGSVVDVIGYGTPLPLHDADGLPMYESQPGPDAPSGSSLSRREGVDTNDNTLDLFVNSVPTPGVMDSDMQ